MILDKTALLWSGSKYYHFVAIGSVCSTCRGAHYKSRKGAFFMSGEQHLHSDTLVIGDDIQESDGTTVSVITVCEESTMPATVGAEVASTGEESETVSSQSQSSQASIPEEEISIWIDEMEEQNSKRQKLNEAVHSISGGRYSPVMSTLNTSWDDVSRHSAAILHPQSQGDHSDLIVCHHSWPRGTGLEGATNGGTFECRQRQPRKAEAF
ncbi:hypothetical protein OS493_025885 [Desmophyllum pertusum]|uniref:Uncharacterized protein n=1 Tax=Desmophyllum pertusum TaxID=174260 RepID=A0A9W9YZ60_9CNID|nr:hypothetical protein OS493_025885 [Desmophyllum pertusum]